MRTEPARRNPRFILFSLATLLGLAMVPALASAGEPAVAPALDETAVIQAIKDAVARQQSLLHGKTDAVVMDKVSAKVVFPNYESIWAVTVEYWLDYAKPEDAPYLKGMQRYYAEVSDRAPKAWLNWAYAQIEQRRDELAKQIAFRQEARQQMMVKAALDQTGKIVPASASVFCVLASGTVPADEYARGIPSDEHLEKAGYDYLKAKSDWLQPAETPEKQGEAGTLQSAGGAGSPGASRPPGTPSASSGRPGAAEPATGSAEAQRLWSAARPNRSVVLAGTGVLAVLVLLAVVSQYLRTRRR